MRVRPATKEKLSKAHAKRVGKTGKATALVNFTNEIIEAGLKSLGLVED